jgi:hypothetical protein
MSDLFRSARELIRHLLQIPEDVAKLLDIRRLREEKKDVTGKPIGTEENDESILGKRRQKLDWN